MRKAARHLSAVIGRVLFIGLTVQAVLGLLWIFCNISSFQEYGDSLFLVNVSESLVCDDYTGILYPLLIRAARGAAAVVPVPYYCLLSLLQLGAGYASAFFFLKCLLSLGGNSKSTPPALLTHWGALVLVTVPVAMQCHLAVLPCSLTGSLLLLQLGVFLRGAWGREADGSVSVRISAKAEAELGILWLAETLLMPEYRWIGVIPVILYGILSILKSDRGNLRKNLGVVLLAAVFLGLTPLAAELTAQTGAYGRMENTFEGAMMRRFCGGTLQVYYGNWPWELRSRISQEDLKTCMSGSEGIDLVMGRKIESALDDRTVRRLYLEMVGLGWADDREKIVSDALDLLGYGFAPVFGRVYLRMSYYDSYARGNYDVMRRQTPFLTALAVRYGSCCFVLGLGLTAVLGLMARLCTAGIAPQKKKLKKEISAGLVCGAMGIWICIWYTMQGQGRMDCKNSMAVAVLWFAWMCFRVIREIGTDEQS